MWLYDHRILTTWKEWTNSNLNLASSSYSFVQVHTEQICLYHIILCYTRSNIYVRLFLKMVIIRLVILVKKESFRRLSTRIFSCFVLRQPPYILIFHFTMLFMKIFATNINKPYTIMETQMRVLGMFFLCLRMCVIKLQINLLPAFVL